MLRELSAGSAVAIRSINETGRGRKAGPRRYCLGSDQATGTEVPRGPVGGLEVVDKHPPHPGGDETSVTKVDPHVRRPACVCGEKHQISRLEVRPRHALPHGKLPVRVTREVRDVG